MLMHPPIFCCWAKALFYLLNVDPLFWCSKVRPKSFILYCNLFCLSHLHILWQEFSSNCLCLVFTKAFSLNFIKKPSLSCLTHISSVYKIFNSIRQFRIIGRKKIEIRQNEPAAKSGWQCPCGEMAQRSP